MKPLLLFACFLIAFFPASAQTPQEEEKIYEFVEQMPQFPGGQTKMMEFLAGNVRYPQEALLKKQEGVAFVTFVVDKKGKIKNTQVLKSASPALDKEAIRVCESMPNWEAGKQNGQAVSVKFVLPVRFQIKNSSVVSSSEADVIPQFPGGHEAMVNFLSDNLQYPAEATANKIEGNVLVSFIVLATGERTDYFVESSPHKSLSEEAARLLFIMPDWEPAKKNNKPIAVRHAISIPFTINQTSHISDIPNDSIINEKAASKRPEFPGGEKAMLRYLKQQIKYPSDAARKGIEGRVIISFVVDSRGKIRNIETLKPLHASLDAEARRVIRSMPSWQPGIFNGSPVNVRFTLPVQFSLHKLPGRKRNNLNYEPPQRNLGDYLTPKYIQHN